MSNNHQSQNDDSFPRFIGLLFLMTILWAASGFFIHRWSGGDPERRGTFGDMFGAINALFSGAALVGVLYSLVLQRRELGLQRQELEETRQELRRTAEAQEKSEKHLVQQAEALALTAKINSLALIPTLTCSAHLDGSSVHFTLLNPGSNPAFDVAAYIVGYYHEDEIDVGTFLRIHLVRDGRLEEPSARQTIDGFTSNEEGFFAVFDSLIYPVMPQRRSVIPQLSFPTPPSGLKVLLQFRDIQGNNYHQLYWLKTDSSGSDYRIGSVDPLTLKSTARVIRDGGYEAFKMDDGSDLPPYLTKEFIPYFKVSLPSILVFPDERGPEDRGRWRDI